MTLSIPNPYLAEVIQTLPRLLSLFDGDRSSRSYGMGDRYFWAWGLIDFGNGTFQGAAHGLARLWHSGLWPYNTPKHQFISRINSLFVGASKLTRKDGSLEEAFPNEGSFCVTALVAFDLICALELLKTEIDTKTRTDWLAIIQPMIAYINKRDETHAIISNHLATAVAALVRWHNLTDDTCSELRAKELLDRILTYQSSEGWFNEYEGADPGYQSLCTYYLADIHLIRPDWKLIAPLRKSIQFLTHFAHPDGSFGGLYGSRCTRFYYPAGILALADEIPEAALLSDFMADSIQKQTVVTLRAMDEPNLVPMFNAYCWAAAISETTVVDEKPGVDLLPALDSRPMRLHYSHAGLLIDRGERHYTIISTHKGGVVSHFLNKELTRFDAGLVITNPKGCMASTQNYSSANSIKWLDNQQLVIESDFVPMPKRLPQPWQFIILRLFSISFFRFSPVREFVKKQLVKMLISGANPWKAKNSRKICLGQNLTIDDQCELPAGYQRVTDMQAFVSIHMASQGYWQAQDEQVNS